MVRGGVDDRGGHLPGPPDARGDARAWPSAPTAARPSPWAWPSAGPGPPWPPASPGCATATSGCPRRGTYPGALANSLGTALIDEVAFRGAFMGLLLAAGLPTLGAIAIQALVYGLATRLGAPGRSHAMLLMSLALGVAAGATVVATGGIGAAVIGHAIARFAIFVCTGHAGQVRRARGGAGGGRGGPPAARRLAGRGRADGGRRPALCDRPAAAGRPVRPPAVLRQPLSVLRLRRLQRRGRARDRAAGWPRSWTACWRRSACGPICMTPPSVRPARRGRPWPASTWVAGRRRSCRRAVSASCWTSSSDGSAWRRTRR